MTSTSTGSWRPDPSGRHELRYHDGRIWTAHVSDQGAEGTDPMTGAGRFALASAAPPPQASAVPLATVPENRLVAMVGALGLIVGALLPWVEARAGIISVDKAGIDGDGIITLVIGVIALIVTFAFTTVAGARRAVVVAAGAIAAIVALYDLLDVQQQANELAHHAATVPVDAGVGIGLWVTAAAAVVLLAGGLMLRRG
jgi:hypothetical protein